MSLRLDMVVTDKISILSQVTHDDVVALREQTQAIQIRTERLQSHANRK